MNIIQKLQEIELNLAQYDNLYPNSPTIESCMESVAAIIAELEKQEPSAKPEPMSADEIIKLFNEKDNNTISIIRFAKVIRAYEKHLGIGVSK